VINKELDSLQEGIMKVQKTMGEQKNQTDRVVQNITKENERL
jgi:peptidoglycan hydrolase CwlO-like protein